MPLEKDIESDADLATILGSRGLRRAVEGAAPVVLAVARALALHGASGCVHATGVALVFRRVHLVGVPAGRDPRGWKPMNRE